MLLKAKNLFALFHTQLNFADEFLQSFVIAVIDIAFKRCYNHGVFFKPLPLASGICLWNSGAKRRLPRVFILKVLVDKLERLKSQNVSMSFQS